MVEVGDEIELSTKKAGQMPRTGVVLAVRERLVTVSWPSGEQSTLVPAPGTMSVVRRARGESAKKKPSTGKKTPSSKNAATAKRSGDAKSKKNVSRKKRPG